MSRNPSSDSLSGMSASMPVSPLIQGQGVRYGSSPVSRVAVFPETLYLGAAAAPEPLGEEPVGVVAAMTTLAMVPAPISTYTNCIYQYGFPEEILTAPADAERQREYALCLATPEEEVRESSTLPDQFREGMRNLAAMASRGGETDDQRFERLLGGILRRKRRRMTI